MAQRTVKEDSLTLTVEQAAHILGISNFLAWKLTTSGEIPSIRLGRLVRVPKARLMAMLEGETKPKKTG